MQKIRLMKKAKKFTKGALSCCFSFFIKWHFGASSLLFIAWYLSLRRVNEGAMGVKMCYSRQEGEIIGQWLNPGQNNGRQHLISNRQHIFSSAAFASYYS